MNHVTHEQQIESIASTIRKLEKTVQTMTSKGANTSLAGKRLKAHQIALAVLNDAQTTQDQTDLAEAKIVLQGLIPSLETSYQKQKAGSPQRTLLERRMHATKMAVQKLDELLKEAFH